MSLFQKLLGKNKREDYYFAEYSIRGVGVISVLLKKNENLFYDFVNHRVVENYNINFLEKLTDYEDVKEINLSKQNAKIFAKKHYKKFHDKFIEFYTKDKDVVELDNCFLVLI